MADQSNIFAGVAGYVGRPDETGKIGVFRRAAAGGEWQHVLTHLETHTVLVHPTDPNIVFAGTQDGVCRSTDRGKTFKRANFPDKGMQIWSFLVDAGTPGASMPAARRSTCIAATTAARAGGACPIRASRIAPLPRSPCASCAWRSTPRGPTRSTPRWR